MRMTVRNRELKMKNEELKICSLDFLSLHSSFSIINFSFFLFIRLLAERLRLISSEKFPRSAALPQAAKLSKSFVEISEWD
jgi:hypothetical protein